MGVGALKTWGGTLLKHVTGLVWRQRIYPGWKSLSGPCLRIYEKNWFFESFQNLHFSLDEACLGVDLARCGCVMDMADGALEMLDVVLFSRGISVLLVACFVANGPGSFTRPRMSRKFFEKFKKWKFWKTIAVVNEETECKSNYTAFGKG